MSRYRYLIAAALLGGYSALIQKQASDEREIISKAVAYIRGALPARPLFVATDLLAADSASAAQVASELRAQRRASSEVFACWEASAPVTPSCEAANASAVVAVGRPKIERDRAIMTVMWRYWMPQRGVFSKELKLGLLKKDGVWKVTGIIGGTIS